MKKKPAGPRGSRKGRGEPLHTVYSRKRRRPMKGSTALLCLILFFAGAAGAAAAENATIDTIATSAGGLKITLVGHGSLVFEHGGKTIHVDPWSKMGDYTKMAKADLVLITHQHRDHLDLDALQKIMKNDTVVYTTEKCAAKIGGQLGTLSVMANGDINTVFGIKIEAVPAYNLIHMRSSGRPFHPKGEGNGYVMAFADKRVYVAGDTENVPEMKALRDIDIAFLPMNLPYTMSSEMAADAAKAFKPKILYPYHTRSSEDQVAGFIELMSGVDGVEIRASR